MAGGEPAAEAESAGPVIPRTLRVGTRRDARDVAFGARARSVFNGFLTLKMYDTVEIPLAPGERFSSRVAEIKSEVEFNVRDPLTSVVPFRSNPYYKQVVDLRQVAEIDAILHLNAKKTGTHKIQIVEAGKKCCGQIAATIASIVDTHPELLAVSRVDTCADVVDGPSVKWMAQSVRAKSAQWQAEFGQAELRDEEGKKFPWSEMGKREVQTMYIGKRPNCFRVYDKLAERFAAWTREKRQHERLASQIVLDKALEAAPRDNIVKASISAHGKQTRDFHARKLVCSGRHYFPFPSFEAWFAAQCVGPMTNVVQMCLPGQEEPEQLDLAPKLPKVLTRVERQMAAGRVPDPLNSIEKLFSKTALDFNPFARLEFSDFHARTEVDMSNYSPVEFAAGMQFKQWLQTGMSYQQLYAYWNMRRNAKAIAKKFAPFVAAANPSAEFSITASDLYDRYRNSVSRQLAA